MKSFQKVDHVPRHVVVALADRGPRSDLGLPVAASVGSWSAPHPGSFAAEIKASNARFRAATLISVETGERLRMW